MQAGTRRRWQWAAVAALAVSAVLVAGRFARPATWGLVTRVRGRATVAERVREYGPAVATRLAPRCRAAGLDWPPARVALLGFKAERRLELYGAAGADDGAWRFVHAYPVLGLSGGPGPKLREGDRQVPEGRYAIASLNPNSRFHLSLELDYPNADDRAQAAREGRMQLGGDIFIHGGDASVGCLALGDAAAEELFVLAALAGPERVTVLLAPADLRRVAAPPADAAWVTELYARLRAELAAFPVTP